MRQRITLLIIFLVTLTAFSSIQAARSAWKQMFDKKSETKKVMIYTLESEHSNHYFARNGFLTRNPKAKATIIIMHGYMCNSTDVGFLPLLFPTQDYNILRFDFRGHGEATPEQYCTFGRDEVLDVKAAVDFIRAQPDLAKMPIFGYGFSMGAVTAIQAQAKYKNLFDALILDCAFDSSENLLRRAIMNMKLKLFGFEFALPGKHWLLKNVFHPKVQSVLKIALKTMSQMDATPINTRIVLVRPVDSIKNIEIPCYFIHCVNDEKVPVSAARALYSNKKRGFKRLWLTQGDKHYGSVFKDMPGYGFRANKFYDNCRTGKIRAKVQSKIIDTSNERVGRGVIA